MNLAPTLVHFQDFSSKFNIVKLPIVVFRCQYHIAMFGYVVRFMLHFHQYGLVDIPGPAPLQDGNWHHFLFGGRYKNRAP